MSTKRGPLIVGEFYHIFNRGNNKQKIFFDDKDRDRFVKLLYLCNSTKRINFREDIVGKKIDAWDFERGDRLVSIGAWVLVPNHFHIYTTPFPNPVGLGKKRELTKDQNNIALYLSRVCNAYSKYFNLRYKRTGSLFEGRFKSVHIKNDAQAKYLFSYIHLNPIKLIQTDWKENGIKNKKEAIKFLDSYRWSSYNDHILKKRPESVLLNLEIFPEYFKDLSTFKNEIFDWLEYSQTP